MIHSRMWFLALSCGFAAALVASSARPATADLNGHWRFHAFATEVSEVTEVGTTVTFSLLINGIVANFTLTRSGNQLSGSAPGPGGGCGVTYSGTVTAGDNAFNGAALSTCDQFGFPITAERCECFDTNGTDGDGCSAECRVEECFACSGEPSVCGPAGNGNACDDGSACTTGETCSNGTCGSGTTVAPCVDMSGGWYLRYDYSDPFGFDFEGPRPFAQRNTSLTAGTLAGSVAPATGSFELSQTFYTVCSVDFGLTDSLQGQVGIDGTSLTGTFVTYQFTGMRCYELIADVTGSRCPGGTLDPGEECDDGNTVNGDGCDDTCQLEACYTCTGTPSVCSAEPDGTTCDKACTTGPTCQDGACVGSAEPDGTSCSDDDACTLNDTCVAGLCTGTALSCGACQVCDGVTPACVPQADFTICDDGNTCTTGDTCRSGSCTGDALFCGPCFGCTAGHCVPAPRTNCLASTTPSRVTLSITDASDPNDDALSWTWRERDAAGPVSLPDPTQTGGYALCIYDESTPQNTALVTAVAPYFEFGCPEIACWSEARNGLRYRSSGDDFGLTRLDLRTPSPGRARALARGKGFFLNPPRAPLSLPLRVQLQSFNASSTETCFEAVYDTAGVRVNDNGVFRARATGP